VFRNTALTSPTTVYVKLHTGAPGEAGTSNAATETTRKAVTFGAPSGGTITSSGAASWTSVAGSETYSHVSYWDASSGGNCLAVGAMAASKSVTAGEDFSFPIGSLTVTLA
jgi:hypothetical protein